jgi:hypothetical protein
MITVDNRVKGRMPPVEAGDIIVCPFCDGEHPVRASEGTGAILFVRCSGNTKLVGVDGKLIVGFPAAVCVPGAVAA